MRIFQDERIEFWIENERCYVKCRQPYEMKLVNDLLATQPRISVSNFIALKEALIKATNEETEFGVYKPEIEIEISKEGLSAYCRLNMLAAEVKANGPLVVTKILTALEQAGVVYGIDPEKLQGDLPVQKRILVATGLMPVAGVDAQLKYFKFSEKKPELRSDGGVDHFDIHLIDPVKVGDWLGEKIPATKGTDGLTVTREVIVAKPGRDFALKYDKATVKHLTLSEGREVLKAAITGAVAVKNQEIAVDNHLVINGNVDYSTGNIDFDGFVTVRGVVEDCFSVVATHDIAILGDMGVGAVALIHSKAGSVFIKGGINGKGQARIVAANDVYLKYLSEAEVICEGALQVGGYAYDAKIKASRVEMMRANSKIVGGSLIAKHQVISGTIGNQYERETEVRVLGFDREQLQQELNNIGDYFKDVLERGNRIKRQIEVFELNLERLDQKATNTYHMIQQDFEKTVQEIAHLKERIKQMEDTLKVRGDGEIKVLSQIHPKSALEIKRHKKHINYAVTGSFFVKDNCLHHIDI